MWRGVCQMLLQDNRECISFSILLLLLLNLNYLLIYSAVFLLVCKNLIAFCQFLNTEPAKYLWTFSSSIVSAPSSTRCCIFAIIKFGLSSKSFRHITFKLHSTEQHPPADAHCCIKFKNEISLSGVTILGERRRGNYPYLEGVHCNNE